MSRKRTAIILATATAVLTVSVIAPRLAFASDNLAAGKSVKVSSTDDSSNASRNAVDGKTATRWSSAYGDSQWIRIDLGAVKAIGSVRLRWEAAYGRAYTIQTSNDKRAWTDRYATTAGVGGTERASFSPVSARYIRMLGTKRGTSWGFSLWEFEVYGPGGGASGGASNGASSGAPGGSAAASPSRSASPGRGASPTASPSRTASATATSTRQPSVSASAPGNTGGGSTAGPDLSGYSVVSDWRFGSGAGRNVADLNALSSTFKPYGIAGTTVINNEWQRYQTFNATNHHLTSDRLELTAATNLGGFSNGGISSGQITTKDTYLPSGGKTYVFQLRAKIPRGTGAWPAFWMYSPGGSGSTSSEIDIFEFFSSPTQNTTDWTGYDHGDGVGADYHSIMTNQWVWHPGYDFAADYHTYTLVWKEGDIQKWVDNTWVKGTKFTWKGPAPQLLVNLAMGGSPNSAPTASGTPMPCVFSVDSLKVYVK